MKTKISLLALSFVLALFVTAETVYKMRDAEGNIIFSDVPGKNTETIEIGELQTINIPEVKGFDNNRTEKLIPETTKYSQLDIISPENNATIRSNEGIVSIVLKITPVLDEKHTIVFSMDDQEVSSGRSLQLSLTDLDRGTHSLNAVIMNENDEILKRSDKRVFHIRKESKLFKNRKNQYIETSGIAPASNKSGNVMFE